MDISCAAANRTLPTQPLSQAESCSPGGDNDDSLSVNSGSSCNSDIEAGPQVCVREMIKRYNSAANDGVKLGSTRRQSHTLLSTKSSFFGVNKFGSQTNVKQFVTQMQEAEKDKDAMKPSQQFCNYSNNKPGDYFCPPRSRRSSIKSVGSEMENNKVFAAEGNNNIAREEMTELQKVHSRLRNVASKDRSLLQSTDSFEQANLQPMESSYQSKTTIAKTASGVRIIIDIFFDQDHNMSSTDVVGSRVETDIPESRILSEFQQQQALSATPSGALPGVQK